MNAIDFSKKTTKQPERSYSSSLDVYRFLRGCGYLLVDDRIR